MRYALCTLRSSEHTDGNGARKVTSGFAQVALESNFQFLVLAVDFLSNQAYKIPIMIARYR